MPRSPPFELHWHAPFCPPPICRTEGREELRRQIGDLRFDLNTLAQAKPKEEKKKALELRKDFINKVWGAGLTLGRLGSL